MEDLSLSLKECILRSTQIEQKWEAEAKEMQLKLKAILNGAAKPILVQQLDSPQQKKKRAKRLSTVDDTEDETIHNETISPSKSSSNLGIRSTLDEEPPIEHQFARPVRAAKLKSEKCLKEPPMNTKLRRPSTFNESLSNRGTTSKQNKSKTEVKLEHEQRQSQMNTKNNVSSTSSVETSSKKSDESIVVISEKESPVVEIPSDEEDSNETPQSLNTISKNKSSGSKQDTGLSEKSLKVIVKREKISLVNCTETTTAADKPDTTEMPRETTNPTTTANTTTTTITEHSTNITISKNVEVKVEPVENTISHTTATKKTRKKKEVIHKPIKVERFSDIISEAKSSPISSRTRKGSTGKQRAPSVYEDAVETLSEATETEKRNEVQTQLSAVANVKTAVCNDTVTFPNNLTMATGSSDATFVSNSAQNNTFAIPAAQTTFIMDGNATVTISAADNSNSKKVPAAVISSDATFNLKESVVNDSLMTEDESFEKPLCPPPAAAPSKIHSKAVKSQTKTKELFNPCVQSPVKKKVEAFENHAQAASTRSRARPKTKENAEPVHALIKEAKSSATTPVLFKPIAPALGRFLTPTQGSNVVPLASNSNVKKMPNSASKTMPFPKQASSNLKSTSSTSSSSLTRENSADDFKKGFNKLQQLAEERKKLREQKHQLAAQSREAKERERAERLQKIAKEREEKKRKKELEMEQKKRELEEINRKLKLQEERDAMKLLAKSKSTTTEMARQERDLLLQMKQPKPQKPLKSKYTFEMLHEDDSTDDEGKTSYKRPSPPSWSLSLNRAPFITSQSFLNTAIIDSFFSVQPMTPDLQQIFPNIDSRYLKRNSSVIWQTPPRYSEMPKY